MMNTKYLSVSHITAGFSAVLIGYTSSIVIILQAATAAGASAAQIESWLLTLGLMMGLSSIGYSWYYKIPILTAWSTPGAAMLVSIAPQHDLPTLVGAFVVTGALIFTTGLVTPLSNALKRIPSPLATAMLAAILLPFCVKAFEPIMSMPGVFLLMFTTYALSKRFAAKYTMLMLLIVGLAAAFYLDNDLVSTAHFAVANPAWLTPEFDVMAIFNVAVPLYIVTMLSQNLSGIAMMQSYGYTAPVKPILVGTGLINMLAAPFGGFSLNLAAISAAMCMTEEVDSNKGNRYRAVIWAGLFYILAGLLATSVVSIFVAFPSEVTQMLAGFALLGTLLMCLQSAFSNARYREASLLTFLVTLSGISFLGLNAIIWGLLLGWFYASLMNKKAENS